MTLLKVVITVSGYYCWREKVMRAIAIGIIYFGWSEKISPKS